MTKYIKFLTALLLFATSFSEQAIAQDCTPYTAELSSFNGQNDTEAIFANNIISIGGSRILVTHPYGSNRLNRDRISDSHFSGEYGLNLGHGGGANSFNNRIETQLTFSNTVKDFTFTINDLDAGDRLRILAYDENDNLISITSDNYYLYPNTEITYHAPIGNIYGETGEFRSSETDFSSNDPLRRATIDFSFSGIYVSKIIFLYYDVDGPGTYTIAKFTGVDGGECPPCTSSGNTSVDLNSAFTGRVPYPDVELQWWTTPDRAPGTAVDDPTNVSDSGTYYAFFFDTADLCYNTNYSTASVEVNILPPCFCTQEPATGAPDGYTKVGITIQDKLNNWPENIPNGFITMESKTKGFVISRVAHVGGTDGTPATEDAIADPKEGMLAYDIQDECVKLFNGSAWNCIERSCNE